MRIRQLQYIVETEKQGFNVSLAASALNTSQPGVSKQIRLLERELGAQIFRRDGGRLIGLTEAGGEVVKIAGRIILDAAQIISTCRDLEQVTSGTLTIATTHVQALYLLPETIKRFRAIFPKVKITLKQMTPQQILESLGRGEVDMGITSDIDKRKDLLVLPCKRFDRLVIVPENHQLLKVREISLKRLAEYPLITYESSFKSREKILRAFEREGATPSIVLSVSDADVIKKCVEKGLGIGVLIESAYNQNLDSNLRAIQAGNLFPKANVGVILNRNHHLRSYEYAFIEAFSEKWNKSNIQRAMSNS